MNISPGKKPGASAPGPERLSTRHPPECTGVRGHGCEVTGCPYVVDYCSCALPRARRCCYHQRPVPTVAPVVCDGADVTAALLASVTRLGDRYATEVTRGGCGGEVYVVVDRLTGARTEPEVPPYRSVWGAFRACDRTAHGDAVAKAARGVGERRHRE